MTLNFLREFTANESISAWEYFAGLFNYDATPFGVEGHCTPQAQRAEVLGLL